MRGFRLRDFLMVVAEESIGEQCDALDVVRRTGSRLGSANEQKMLGDAIAMVQSRMICNIAKWMATHSLVEDAESDREQIAKAFLVLDMPELDRLRAMVDDQIQEGHCVTPRTELLLEMFREFYLATAEW